MRLFIVCAMSALVVAVSFSPYTEAADNTNGFSSMSLPSTEAWAGYIRCAYSVMAAWPILKAEAPFLGWGWCRRASTIPTIRIGVAGAANSLKKKLKNFWSRHADIKPDEEKVAPFYVYGEVSDSWTDPETGIHYNSDYVPVWRWRRAMYNDLKCRMDWCVKPYIEANHHPKAAFNGDASDTIIRLTPKPGEIVALASAKPYLPCCQNPNDNIFQNLSCLKQYVH